jgi:hypothetical protein
MKPLTQCKTITPSLLVSLLLVCFALLPRAHAVSPPPDGGYPGGNTAEGTDALLNLTNGVWNTGTGFEALNHLTAGNQNTATGLRALFSDTDGGFNTATGVYSLFSNTTGFFNSATGAYALANNTEGNWNTANGYAALYYNAEGELNTATGFAALYGNTTGGGNTATGYQTLNRNTNGSGNTANGYQALLSNTTGEFNTANGAAALYNNTEGSGNTADGYLVLYSNTTGDTNTASGDFALYNNTTGSTNAASGYQALFFNTTGNANTALGSFAGSNVSTANNVICIGTGGANVSDSCFIGNIRGTTTGNVDAVNVVIDSAGQLGTVSSSRRYKKEIKPMDSASEVILALKPVTFHYKSDPKDTPQFGLIAEEVAEVDPDLTVRDENGEIYTVRYDHVNAMLLNEFLKAHRKAQQQEATITELKRGIEILTAQFKEQAAQIQKVSAQLEMSEPAARTAANK